MTRAELEDHVGLTKYDFGGCLSRMCRDAPKTPQRLHVVGYVYDHEGARRYPRAIYAYGPGPNKPKPKNTRKRDRVLSYQRQINRVRNSSVFNLALPRNAVRAMKKNVRSASVHMEQGS